MTIQLSHFSAALIFAICASIVFGVTLKNSFKEMPGYALYCWALFIGGVILAGWVMWLIKR